MVGNKFSHHILKPYEIVEEIHLTTSTKLKYIKVCLSVLKRIKGYQYGKR